ncbi:hypothetical protein CYMTET_26771 [Cymbomonas tetramitiformis]|uniref:Uncharacterized protein n=1 Tax=Cymbomonas tetramitiformis TaxID=36881 RepID=A0AAE0FR51_9CHLO|nr:hypothetical protein CYMTET_26771 [Cymbomonas tetramitiformis]
MARRPVALADGEAARYRCARRDGEAACAPAGWRGGLLARSMARRPAAPFGMRRSAGPPWMAGRPVALRSMARRGPVRPPIGGLLRVLDGGAACCARAGWRGGLVRLGWRGLVRRPMARRLARRRMARWPAPASARRPLRVLGMAGRPALADGEAACDNLNSFLDTCSLI